MLSAEMRSILIQKAQTMPCPKQKRFALLFLNAKKERKKYLSSLFSKVKCKERKKENTGMSPKLRHIEFETLSIYLKITLVKIKIYKNFLFD